VATPPSDPHGSREQPGTQPAHGLDQTDEVIDGELASEDETQPDRRLVWSASFRGPLPPPDVLAAYDEATPGLAREIVEQWKAETAHRHHTIDGLRAIDQEAMRTYYKSERHGQRIALIAFLAVIALAIVVAVVLRSEAVAIAAIVTGGASAVWALRRRSDSPSPPIDLADGNAIEKPDEDRK
jgi:uncharacterized membrane protein